MINFYKMKTCVAQLLLLLSCCLLANFEAQAKGLPEFRANLEIDLKDIKQPSQIKLVFEMYTNVNLNYTLQKSIYDYEIKSSITHIALPLTDSLNYGRIKLWIDNVLYQFNHDNNLFLFAEGDQIKMSLEDKKVSFLGAGSEKYNCLNMQY